MGGRGSAVCCGPVVAGEYVELVEPRSSQTRPTCISPSAVCCATAVVEVPCGFPPTRPRRGNSLLCMLRGVFVCAVDLGGWAGFTP